MLGAYEQLAVQIETQEGVVMGSEASSHLIRIKDLELSPEFERYQRELRRGTLSQEQDLAGRLSAELSFTVEMAGPSSGTITDQPIILSLLRSAGYRILGDADPVTGPYAASPASSVGRLARITIGASWTTGTKLDQGTTITDGTGTGVVVGTYREGDNVIFARLTSTANFDGSTNITATGFECTQSAAALAGYGFYPIDKPTTYIRGTAVGTIAVGDIVEGVTSGAKGQVIEVPSSTVILVERAPGFGYFSNGETVQKDGSNQLTSIQAPVQYDIPSLSITYYNDGTRLRLKGCRASAQITMENGMPGLIRFTVRGVWAADDGAASLTAANDQANPSLYLGATLSFLDVSGSTRISPLMNQLQIDTNSEVAPREDVTDANGFAFASSSGRAPRLTANPEAIQEGTFDWWANARQANLLQIYTEWGTAASGNAFHVRAPGISYTLGQGERNGQRIYDVDGQLSSVADAGNDEVAIFTY